MDIKAFAARYRISTSWARQLVRAGDVKAEKIKGRYYILPEEGERWMIEHPYRYWVRNISRPDLPAIALDYYDTWTLYLCARDYGADVIEYRRGTWEPRVHRLQELGFTIERRWRRGTYPYYCLKDIVEIEFPDKVQRLGPHPDYLDLS